jgi:hypothetical protein
VEPSTSLILIKPACEGFTNLKGLGEFLFLILSCDTWMYNGKNHGYILKNGMPCKSGHYVLEKAHPLVRKNFRI